ncbi:glycosyl transferase family 2 [Oscillochloris trichoides DG-6]|uniref:Glycosyl transferase family 2 n=1 Tax=Oscillochloris trichoides DG-6 TaxID=765420 RepID=E1I9M5_9CHLR|nr:glycosyltransferase family 2 protein [Oscillochloris trichoides]EFO82103.1 glycosyl transferase family 2 [Oscillochloris trichoides DG-6]
MTPFFAFLTRLLILGEIGLKLVVDYLLLLTAAALVAPRTTPLRAGSPTTRFVIMIPAHNEERLLPQLLHNLAQLDYPNDLYQVHVVADNCTDQTAARGRAAGAIVHERFNQELRGKGYALEWLLEQIWERGDAHDAIVILDADSIVSSNFLRVMDSRIARGERVIQAYYAVRAPESSASAGIRAVALTVLHYLRPQGRMVLGGSTGLKGNGMVFVAEILRQHRWTASLTEDIEYHMDLIRAGERAMFAPDAVVWAEMPDSLKASQTQNERWERGRMEMIRNYVPALLREGLRKRSFLLLDAAIEQLIPPFSIVVGMSGLAMIAALISRSRQAIMLAIAIITGQIAYIFTGLALARAPWALYRALLFAPVFLFWKIVLYVRLLLGIKPDDWVRTARNSEE